MNKYELVFDTSLKMMRITFLEYISGDDLEGFGNEIANLLQERMAPWVLGDFSRLGGKKLKVLGKEAREFVASLGDRYGVSKVAVFGVPVVFRTIIRGIMVLLKNKLEIRYQFFPTEEKALEWLTQES